MKKGYSRFDAVEELVRNPDLRAGVMAAAKESDDPRMVEIIRKDVARAEAIVAEGMAD
ncbi:hypothetical protein Gdia_0571 [Gluconacetobacter diazotrophicus PA1 5]|uniref:hypothetical protein n=1 Tax=Gluconacetobacter diazotrophicus TaxID=33996 RepID=UPI000181EFB4|nr:hypothetical protein [Gluconacetobacter diazotrophicus]ACI50363.1 hypothetical protein Gdia_0571 [Gluconacetobacter diazotrophicus PA1 5]